MLYRGTASSQKCKAHTGIVTNVALLKTNTLALYLL